VASAGPGRALRLMEVLSLGRNRALCVVRMNETIFLVGVTDHALSVLHSEKVTRELT